MGIKDPIEIQHSEKYGYTVVRGRETFYDQNNNMLTFDTYGDAIEWVHAHDMTVDVTDDGEPAPPRRWRGTPVPEGQIGFDDL